MCTINISLDDQLLKAARAAFTSDDSLLHWLKEQLTALLKSKAKIPLCQHAALASMIA